MRRIIVDTREPWPHPWAEYLPEGLQLERGTLETGDIALAALPEGAVIERKTPADLASCIGAGRERFERELRRGRYIGRLIVVIEGGLADVCLSSRSNRRLNHNAITGTIAAWTLRYCPFVFCGSERAAADFAFRFLAAQDPRHRGNGEGHQPMIRLSSLSNRIKSPWRLTQRQEIASLTTDHQPETIARSHKETKVRHEQRVRSFLLLSSIFRVLKH